MKDTEKTYLGDGVYVKKTNGMIELTSENGVSVLDRIYLEDFVLKALVRFAGLAEETEMRVQQQHGEQK